MFVAIGSISMPICNRFYSRLANNDEITTFRGYRSLMLSYASFFEPRRSRLAPLKSTLRSMLKISYAVCLGLSVVNLTQFALGMCLADQNYQKIYKNPYFNVQGHPRSLLSVAIESPCTALYYVINSNVSLISHRF